MSKRPTGPSIDQRRAQWLKGALDLCVLGALRGGEAYGYELAQRLELAGLGPMKGGTLYPLLSRLERGGLVAATWRASSQGPDRKYYHLTDEGDAALSTASKEWRVFVEAAAFLIDDGGGSP